MNPRTLCCLVLLVLFGGRVRAEQIIYVDDDAAPGGDGLSWNTAHSTLQAALDGIPAGQGAIFHVGQGTYRPTKRLNPSIPRSASFVLPDGITLLGGFAGLSHSQPDLRSDIAYPSILSGDLNENDGLEFQNMEDNADELVKVTAGSASIDGMRLVAGRVGLRTLDAQITLKSCTFLHNAICGAFLASTQALITNCTFHANGDWSQSPTVGGIWCTGSTNAQIQNCRFWGNTGTFAPALRVDTFATAAMVNSAVWGSFGYDAAINNGGVLTLTNCLVASNRSQRILYWVDDSAGGIFNSGTLTLSNNIIWGNAGNDATGLDGQITDYSGNITAQFNCIEGWEPGGQSDGNISLDPRFLNFNGPDGVLGSLDDDFRLLDDSPCIDAGNSDSDIDTGEPGVQPLPAVDLIGMPRVVDDPLVPDTGMGADGVVDIGPLEGAVPAVRIMPTSLSIAEGSTVELMVWLNRPPADPVLVQFSTDGDGDITVVPGEPLTFSQADYFIPKTVQLHCVADPGFTRDATRLTATAPRFYTGVASIVEDDALPAPSVIFVDADAAGLKTGLNWEDAFENLETALQVADAHEAIQQVWIAEGTYRPQRRLVATDPHTATFVPRPGLTLYGGFSGVEASPDERDIAQHPSILSGDLAGNDFGNFDAPSWRENAHAIVTIFPAEEAVTLDGLTLTHGNNRKVDPQPDNSGGAAVNNRFGSMLLRHCSIQENYSRGYGGAVQNRGVARFEDCVFLNNAVGVGGRGGAISNTRTASLEIEDCEFTGNRVIDNDGYGGAIYSVASFTVRDSTFIDNVIELHDADDFPFNFGGAIMSLAGIDLDGCYFAQNYADDGGAVYASTDDEYGPLRIVNCWFEANTAEESGSAVLLSGDNECLVENCTFIGNELFYDSSPGTGAAAYIYTRSPVVRDCVFEDNVSPIFFTGGGLAMFAINGSTGELSNSVFRGNSAWMVAGAYVNGCSVINCDFLNNQGQSVGGLWLRNGKAENCRFIGNQATAVSGGIGGGGAYLGIDSTVTGCIFNGNWSAVKAGAILCESAEGIRVINCTIVNNEAQQCGGLFAGNARPYVQNTIFSNNTFPSIEGTALSVSFCLFGVGLPEGSGNISGNPQFVDPAGTDGMVGTEDDDLRLAMGSPCVNSGSGVGVDLPELDIDGQPRVAFCRVDIGAHESPHETAVDCDASGANDYCEIANGLAPDCNGNFSPDGCDVASGASADTDQNGTPDECDLRILYVRSDSADGGDGSSWASATNDLHAALALASVHHGPVEIWMAAGVYQPSVADPYAEFQIPSGVAVLGGFAGYEGSAAERDPEINETVISGDILGNDNVESPCCAGIDGQFECDDEVCVQTVCNIIPSCCTNWSAICANFARNYCPEICAVMNDNSRRLLDLSYTDESTLVDGLILRNCQGAHLDSVLYFYDSRATIRRCRIEQHVYTGGGGCVFVERSAPTFEECEFSAISTQQGGVLIARAESTLTLERCVFRMNTGVSVSVDGHAHVIARRCRFVENDLAGRSVVFTQLFSSTTLENCLIANNTGSLGSCIRARGTSLIVRHCTLTGNETGGTTAGIYSEPNGIVQVDQSILWNNSAAASTSAEQAQVNFGAGLPGVEVRYSCVQGLNWYAGNGNIGEDPAFLGTIGEEFDISLSSPCIDAGDSQFVAGESETDLAGSPRIAGCRADIGAYEFATGDPGSGDFDGDGMVGTPDIPAFVEALTRDLPLGACLGDWSGDDHFDGRDIQLFVDALLE